MVKASGVEDAWGSYTCDDDIFSSGELDAGGIIEGVLIGEQSMGDDNLCLKFFGLKNIHSNES